MRTDDPNLPLLEEAAARLAPFLQEIVFIGGVALGLLITDKGAAPIRGTNDVDVIAGIITYADYIEFSQRLRRAHFTEDSGEEPLACRWRHGKLVLDVLAIRKEVLGYTNIWYEGALGSAVSTTLPSGKVIRVISAPFFLGTKMEAFRGRGKMDFLGSHDLEDFVAVVEGRDTLLHEIVDSPSDLREYLADAVKGLLNEPRFLDALPGFVLNDERVPLIRRRLVEIASLSPTAGR